MGGEGATSLLIGLAGQAVAESAIHLRGHVAPSNVAPRRTSWWRFRGLKAPATGKHRSAMAAAVYPPISPAASGRPLVPKLRAPALQLGNTLVCEAPASKARIQ